MERAQGRRVSALFALSLASCGPAPEPKASPPPSPSELAAPASFASIAEPAARSQAMFVEATRVLLHPRCTNCHPTDDAPRQRNGEAHDPPVARGDDDRGVVGLACTSCHQDKNIALSRVPGAPGWHLAPRSMGWLGKSPAEVCAQLKDPSKNGGRTPAQIVEHVSHDPLVAWGWDAGADRAPVPGTQARFGALVAAWIETGAVCPPKEAR